MKTIYKYPISTQGVVSIPKGATILTAAHQNGDIYVWAEVDTDAAIESVRFVVFGTGNEIYEPAEDLEYVGTVFEEEFVWHVYRFI